MTKATVVIRNDKALLPSYGLEEVHFFMEPKAAAFLNFIDKRILTVGKVFRKSLPRQILLLLTSNPNTISSTVRGGEYK